jgi:hypothetical protein
MRNIILFIFFFFAVETTFSQVKKNIYVNSFINLNVGTEYKRNNSDSLTSGIINYTPLLRVSFGQIFNKKLYYSCILSRNKIDYTIENNRMNYKKLGTAIYVGLNKETNKFSIKNQIGIQFNEYSLTDLKQDNVNQIDNFNYVGNYFESKNDTYLGYGLELSSIKNKNMNLMSGLNASYAVGKSSILTRKPSEKFVFQIYLGVSYSL